MAATFSSTLPNSTSSAYLKLSTDLESQPKRLKCQKFDGSATWAGATHLNMQINRAVSASRNCQKIVSDRWMPSVRAPVIDTPGGPLSASRFTQLPPVAAWRRCGGAAVALDLPTDFPLSCQCNHPQNTPTHATQRLFITLPTAAARGLASLFIAPFRVCFCPWTADPIEVWRFRYLNSSNIQNQILRFTNFLKRKKKCDETLTFPGSRPKFRHRKFLGLRSFNFSIPSALKMFSLINQKAAKSSLKTDWKVGSSELLNDVPRLSSKLWPSQLSALVKRNIMLFWKRVGKHALLSSNVLWVICIYLHVRADAEWALSSSFSRAARARWGTIVSHVREVPVSLKIAVSNWVLSISRISLCICDVSSCRLPFNRRMIIDTRATIRRFRAVPGPSRRPPGGRNIPPFFLKRQVFLFGQRPLDVSTMENAQSNEWNSWPKLANEQRNLLNFASVGRRICWFNFIRATKSGMRRLQQRKCQQLRLSSHQFVMDVRHTPRPNFAFLKQPKS